MATTGQDPFLDSTFAGAASTLDIEQLIAMAEQGGSTDAIGGYFNPGRAGAVPMGGLIGGGNTGAVADPYREGAQWEILQSMPTEQRVSLQEQLASLGFIRGDFRLGRIDDATLTGMTELLSIANREGLNWEMVLSQEKDRVAKGGQPLAGVSKQGQVFALPSTDTLKVSVRDKFRAALGRDPTEAEMRLFTDEMMADYQSNVDRQKQTVEDVGSGRDVTVQEEDPASAFDLAFEQKYRPEMVSNERQAGALQGAQSARVGVDSAAQAAGV